MKLQLLSFSKLLAWKLVHEKVALLVDRWAGFNAAVLILMNQSIAVMNHKPTNGFCGASSRLSENRLYSPDGCFYRVFISK